MPNEKNKIKKFTLLLVEDNEDEIILFKEALRSQSPIQEIIVERDGEKALEYLKSMHDTEGCVIPDIVLLDLNMPKKGGLEVLTEIKSDPALKGIPVIIFTTSKSESDIKFSYDNFASCYISKPMSFEGLKGVIVKIEEFWLNLVELP